MSISKLTVFIGFFTLLGCGSAQTESQLDLVGGTQATARQYGSAVYYDNVKCTGTKVSKRHILTAAHCVADSKGRSVLPVGRVLKITNFPTRDENNTKLWHSGTIKAVHIEAEYASVCATSKTSCDAALSKALLPPPDVAIIELAEDLPVQWPTAQVDVRNVLDGDALEVVGYGCEEGLDGKKSNIIHKKIGKGAVISSYRINNWGLKVDKPNLDFFASRYFLTPGILFDKESNPDGFSLCPGDSGGPVYRPGKDIVVGVHADYTFSTEDRVSSVNIHTRLIDPWHRSNVDLWLKSVLPTSSFVYSGQNQSL